MGGDGTTVERHREAFRRNWGDAGGIGGGTGEELSDERARREPRVVARETTSDEIPRAASSVARHAGAHGWRVRVLYAEGPEGQPSLSVRCRRVERGALRWACGLWRSRDGKWSFSAGLVADVSDGLRKVGSRELRAYLAGVGSDEDADSCPTRGSQTA